MQRLLESGQRLAPAGEPMALHLEIRSLRRSVLVEVEQGRRRETLEVDEGDVEATVLEIAHAASDLVARFPVDPEVAAAHDGRAASVRFVGFVPDGVQVATTADALLASNFLVVGGHRTGAWRLCVWRVASGYVLDRATLDQCIVSEDAIAVQTLGEGVKSLASQMSDSVTAALVDSVDARLQARGEPTSQQAIARRPEPAAPVVEETRRRPRRPRVPWLEARVDGGAQFRAVAVDGNVNIAVAAGANRVGAMLRVEFLPSTAPSLSILDTVIGLGPALGWPVRKRLHLSVAILAGLLVHRARYERGDVLHRQDFAMALPFMFDVGLRGGWALYWSASFGFATMQRTHLAMGSSDALWSRGSVRAGLSIGVRYRWSGRRRNP